MRRREKGLCARGRCTRPPKEGRIRCEEHLREESKRATARNRRITSEGRCAISSCRTPPRKGRAHCAVHAALLAGRGAGHKTTYEERLMLYAAQDGKCAICLTTLMDEFAGTVDHDHTSREIRGMLCQNCNKGLGCFRDSSRFMIAAALYLSQQKKTLFKAEILSAAI